VKTAAMSETADAMANALAIPPPRPASRPSHEAEDTTAAMAVTKMRRKNACASMNTADAT
jgi:hypothetical protein